MAGKGWAAAAVVLAMLVVLLQWECSAENTICDDPETAKNSVYCDQGAAAVKGLANQPGNSNTAGKGESTKSASARGYTLQSGKAAAGAFLIFLFRA